MAPIEKREQLLAMGVSITSNEYEKLDDENVCK